MFPGSVSMRVSFVLRSAEETCETPMHLIRSKNRNVKMILVNREELKHRNVKKPKIGMLDSKIGMSGNHSGCEESIDRNVKEPKIGMSES
jgi:hypothetical protein